MTPNLRAFLDMIAFAEGVRAGQHSLTRCDGYDVIVTGIDGPEIFTDLTTHPFSGGRPSKRINSKGLTSNASGRYQFMLRDWGFYKLKLGLPDFGPESQDKWALQLIKERRALDDIEAGHFVVAVGKVANLWASLPGAGYGQREHRIASLENAYEQAGGTFA